MKNVLPHQDLNLGLRDLKASVIATYELFWPPLIIEKFKQFLFFQDIRIGHTVILDDPFEDPPGLEIPDRSPPPSKEMLASSRIGADEDLVTLLKFNTLSIVVKICLPLNPGAYQ